MKKIFILLLPVLFFTACDDKEITAPHPEMRYTELNNVPVKFGQHKSLDLDGDNMQDLLFSTVLIGDPIARVDKRRYFVNGAFDAFSLVNAGEETPPLHNGDAITISNPPGFNWYNASSLMLAEKIIEETGPDHWEGNWKNTDHKFLPVQLRKNQLRYNGWVEISFKMDAEEVILHRAAIAKEPGKDVIAGLLP